MGTSDPGYGEWEFVLLEAKQNYDGNSRGPTSSLQSIKKGYITTPHNLTQKHYKTKLKQQLF